MARLDPVTRERLGRRLQKRLPAHWRVYVGERGHPFVELDQDGRRADHQFPTLGTTVIMISHGAEDAVEVNVYRRVKHPPGFSEGREYQVTLASVNGPGWLTLIENSVIEYAIELEAALSTSEVAEA